MLEQPEPKRVTALHKATYSNVGPAEYLDPTITDLAIPTILRVVIATDSLAERGPSEIGAVPPLDCDNSS